MQVVSLHPVSQDVVRAYVAALLGGSVPESWRPWFSESLASDVDLARSGNERAINRVTLGLAQALADEGPSFYGSACGLSFWEARVDRPIGMILRPPSRLFTEAGLDSTAARSMPIRLDSQLGMMGGAYIPARLVDQAVTMLDDHLERSARRLAEAEVDAFAALGVMQATLAHARKKGTGVFEAQDLLGPHGETLAGRTTIGASRSLLDGDFETRIELALTPPKKPGLWQRLTGGGRRSPVEANGQASDPADEPG